MGVLFRRKTKVTGLGVGHMLGKNVTSTEDKVSSDPIGILADSNCTSVGPTCRQVSLP